MIEKVGRDGGSRQYGCAGAFRDRREEEEDQLRLLYDAMNGRFVQWMAAEFAAFMERLDLTPKQKALLLLKLDGVSHRRIAAAWGVSRQAVERLWARAKRNLPGEARAGDLRGLQRELGLHPAVRRLYGWQAVYLETTRLLGRG